MFFSRGVADHISQSIRSAFQMVIGNPTGCCLGIPYFIGISKFVIFNFLTERIWKKFSGWKERFFSSAG